MLEQEEIRSCRVARRQQMDHDIIGDGNMQPTPVTMQESVVRLVPDVLKRVFSFVGLADNVNCHVAHWLIRSVACEKLHGRLVHCKNGMFLLKWPLCFHNNEDCNHWDRQFRFINLTHYNVSRQVPPAQVIDQIQVFLAGYESMMLNEVLASAVGNRYSDLATLMVDFSLYYKEAGDADCAEDQALPFREKRGVCGSYKASKPNHVHEDKCFGSDKLFSGNWQLWSQTITTIIDSCSASLLHFVFTSDSFARDDSYYSYNKLKLPGELYQSLNFDRMMTKTQNVQTLYLPIRDLATAFAKKIKQNPMLEVWPLLRAIAPNQRVLPMLRRIVVESGDDLLSDSSSDLDPRAAGRIGCSLPALPLSVAEVMVEAFNGRRWDVKKNARLVFPNAKVATWYNAGVVITPLPSPTTAGHPTLCYLQNNDADTQKKFADEVLEVVKSEALTRDLRQRLSVWNDVLRLHPGRAGFESAAKKAYIELLIMDPAQLNKRMLRGVSRDNKQVTETLSMLIHMLKTRQISSSFDRISISDIETEDLTWGAWGVMRQLLPFFAVNGNTYLRATDNNDDILAAMQININLGGGVSMRSGDCPITYGGKLKEWREAAKECKDGSEKLLRDLYKFPHINLSVKEWKGLTFAAREIAPRYGTVDDASAWVEVIERKVLHKIRLFVRDAVKSCERRDLSFSLYQSLRHVKYEFKIYLRFDGHNADGRLMKRIVMLSQSRAAKLEQRVLCDVFARELEYVNEVGTGATQPVLAFSALRSMGGNIQLEFQDTKEYDELFKECREARQSTKTTSKGTAKK